MNPAAPQRLLHEALLRQGTEADSGGRRAAIVAGQDHTWAQTLDDAQRLAAGLRQLGVRRGQRVAIYMDNSWPALVSIYATLLAGGVFVPVNPLTRSDKLGFILDDCEATVLLADTALASQFQPLLASRSSLQAIVAGRGDHGPQMEGFDTVLAEHAPLQEPPATIPTDLAALIYTSGSTGQPKGVMQTHQSMLFAATSIIQYLRLGPGERILCALPLAFDYGLYQWLMTVQLGATLVLERSFAFPAQIFERMREFEVTVFPGVPTVFAMLLAAHHRERLEFPGVTRVTNTAAALPDAQALELREIFPNALIFKMYGQTECKRVAYLEPERLQDKPGSVGKAIPGTEVLLRSPDGRDVPAGQPGILHVRGPHVMAGYWKRPRQNAATLVPGPVPGERMLCTHDWFRMDAEGYLYFVGRSDDIIKSRGEKVSPVEVENVLQAIDGVREAAVVGVPDPILGQAIRAHVVLQPGSELSAARIRARCRQQLESFMVPQEVVLCHELPQTASGKVSRKALLEQATQCHE